MIVPRSTAPWKFLSTPSARRATEEARKNYEQFLISIHALREEGDPDSRGTVAIPYQFLSTPSARRATCWPAERNRRVHISIHALREEGDSKNRDKISIFKQIIQHSARI